MVDKIKDDYVPDQMKKVNIIDTTIAEFLHESAADPEMSKLIKATWATLKINLLAIIGSDVYNEVIREEKEEQKEKHGV